MPCMLCKVQRIDGEEHYQYSIHERPISYLLPLTFVSGFYFFTVALSFKYAITSVIIFSTFVIVKPCGIAMEIIASTMLWCVAFVMSFTIFMIPPLRNGLTVINYKKIMSSYATLNTSCIFLICGTSG